MINYKFFRKA